MASTLANRLAEAGWQHLAAPILYRGPWPTRTWETGLSAMARASCWWNGLGETMRPAYRSASRQGYNAIEDGWLVYELHRVGRWDLGKRP